jgi:hypothetical protein
LTGEGFDLPIQIPADQIYLKFSPGDSPKVAPTGLIILDTGNHCVRKLNFDTNRVSTIAGICGTSGFIDGPLGKALFNKPDRIGFSTTGDIYIFDKGNKYLRKLVLQDADSDTWLVKTMIGGTCRNIEEVKGVEGLSWIGFDAEH